MKKEYGYSFTDALIFSLSGVLGVEFEVALKGEILKQFHDSNEIIVNIPFAGEVSGNYIITLNYSTAYYLKNIVSTDNDPDILNSILTEMLNTAVGSAIKTLSLDYYQITFFAPSISHAPVIFPKTECFHSRIKNQKNYEIDLYLRIDSMGLDLHREYNESLEENQRIKNLYSELEKEKKRSEELMTKAQEADKVKSEFLAVMSHEMRTPLNAIIGFTDILVDEKVSTEQRDMLMTVKRSSDNLLAIINDILDLTKIEANQIEFEDIDFNLEDILYDSAEMARARLKHDHVEINVDFRDVYSLVSGDATKVKQIITNLLSNAAKFTSKGEILLSVKILYEDTDYQYLKFSVKDTGIGMSPKQCKVIFEPFKQADSSTTRKFGGTGLGLSIFKGLVTALGGTFSVNSSLGNGSEFIFDLKLRKAKNIQPNKHDDSLKGSSALIIDDNQNAREILAHHLTKAGVTVSTYDHFNTFLEDSQNVCFDLVYLDIMMPDVDGFGVAQKLKENKAGKHFIASTAVLSPEITSRIHNSCFDTFICKPVRPSYVIYSAKKVLRKIKDEASTNVRDFEGTVLNILVVEDNLTNQKLINKILTKMGHKVELANHGKEALSMLHEEHQFDIVFMDMQMPVMGGLDATKEIRKRNYLADLPVVAMTANALAADRDKCIKAGMNDYLSKPVKRELIWDMFNKYCYDRDVPYVEQPRLLVIEDDLLIQKLLQTIFSEFLTGFSWKFASNGIEACTLLGGYQPHLIITDMIMPKMDGSEFIEFIRNNNDYKDCRIIVLTSLDSNSEKITDVKNIGIDGVIYKPFKKNDILTTIKDQVSALLGTG